jgi:hypothetical protein
MEWLEIPAATLQQFGIFTLLGITSQQLYVCWISYVTWLESMDMGGQTVGRLSYSVLLVQRWCSAPSPVVYYRFIAIDIKRLEQYVAAILQPMNSCPYVGVCVNTR